MTSTSGQQGMVNLHTAMSFADFQALLHINIDRSGGFGMFSAEAEADYLRSIQDLDYSLSLNYSEFLYDTVNIRLFGPNQKALTESGKDIYNDPDIKKYFNILCGDDFISSYQQGAALLMGLNIRFHSHSDKQQFTAKSESSFGNLYSASNQIQLIAQQYHINGRVIIQAYQKGGNPAELSKILAKDDKGVYYSLSCDLQHMDNCVKAANGLLNYAVDNFPKQVSFNPDKGLVPLGPGFIKHDPIAEYGLTPAPSLVTKEVAENRIFLGNALKENQYYQQKIDTLLLGYPVQWDKNSEIYKAAAKLYKMATNNIDAINAPSNPDDGALKCYSHPTLCAETTRSIKEKMQPITATELRVLEPLRYGVYSNFAGNWLPVDRANRFMHKDDAQGFYYGDIIFSLDPKINMNVAVVMHYYHDWTTIRGSLPYTKDGYVGRLLADNGAPPVGAVMGIIFNPYFFDVYKPETSR